MGIRKSTTSKVRAESAAVPKSQSSAEERVRVPYVDYERDYRDHLVLAAIKVAIDLIDECHPDSEAHSAGDVLRLVRDRMASEWPKSDVKFAADVVVGAAEVRHG